MSHARTGKLVPNKSKPAFGGTRGRRDRGGGEKEEKGSRKKERERKRKAERRIGRPRSQVNRPVRMAIRLMYSAVLRAHYSAIIN